MQATSLSDLFGHPSFLTLLMTFLTVIANIMVGVSMLPKDGRKKRYRLHRALHAGVVCVYLGFLWINQEFQGNTWFHYFVLVYFLAIVPLTRRIHVTLHAVLASVGLVMLLGLVMLTI